jgi:hypothetical protein
MKTARNEFARALALAWLWTVSMGAAESLTVTPRPGSEAAGLSIRSSLFPGDDLDLRTCEGVLAGDRDFGLFQVKLAPAPAGQAPSWSVRGKTLSYAWTYPAGITVRFVGRVERDALALEYRMENHTTNALDRVQIHTCITTTRAPSFFPAPTILPARTVGGGAATNFMELYDRLFLWRDGKPFSFASSPLARAEVHLAFMRAGETPVKWGWWVNAPQTFDFPLIVARSRDGQGQVGLAFGQAIWASSNVGDDRACFHLFPNFGRIEPGGSATVHGRFYVGRGSLEKLKTRVARDLANGFRAASSTEPDRQP